MELKHIEIFLLSIELGSISAAARKMGKQQSVASQWIADLEADLNITLFQRSKNKSQPTEEARLLAPQLKQILTQAQDLKRSAELVSHGEPSILSVLIDEWVPALPVTNAIHQFSQLYPHLILEVQAMPRELILEQVAQQPTCIGLVTELNYHHDHLQYQRIGFYEDVLVASPHFPLAKQKNITVDDLSRFRELVWATHEDGIENEGFGQVYSVINDLQTLIALLEKADSYALLHRQSIDLYLAQKRLITLDCQFEQVKLNRRIECVWSPATAISTTVKELKDCIIHHHDYQQ